MTHQGLRGLAFPVIPTPFCEAPLMAVAADG